MPKERLTCTRCSQRRQKCDRKSPCSRCVQNKEAHLCTTQWKEGYNPSVHRRYPRKQASVGPSPTESSDTTSTLLDSPPELHQGQSGTSTTAPEKATIPQFVSDPITGPGFRVGPSRFIDITIGSLLDEKHASNQDPSVLSQSMNYVQCPGRRIHEPNRVVSFCSPAARVVEAQYLQSLLPGREATLNITDYYHKNMLYWMGGFYHHPSFREKLLRAYDSSTTPDLEALDWRWSALLFAILSSSIIASPEALASTWGFSLDDKIRLSRDWGAAAVSCLNMGNYTSQYHICSVQAIYVLHAYEHLTGSTNQWIALKSTAVVIAKGLGLHRLGPHPDDDQVREHNATQKQEFLEREIGRRVWSASVCQEWLCSTIQSGNTPIIQKRHFTSINPRYVDEETMQPVDDDTPCFILMSRWLYDYSSLLLEYHNAILDIGDVDDAIRYATVLKFDGALRAVGAENAPKLLSPRTPIDPSWPSWIKWARTLHQASINHKLIMLHQSFLSKSFKDVRYTYTRWACATAAKNVIQLYKTRDPDEPQWWVEQAFIVTSAICLMLDLFNRPPTDVEVEDYLGNVQHAVRFLQQFTTSSVALHGVRLLLSLLQEYNNLHEGARPQPAAAKCNTVMPRDTVEQDQGMYRALDGQCLPSNPEVPLSNEEMAQFNFDIDTIPFEDIMDWLPLEGGLDNNVFYDSICGLSGTQFL